MTSTPELLHSEAGSGIPPVVAAPAPWQLRGDAWIFLMSMPKEIVRDGSFTPAALRGREGQQIRIAWKEEDVQLLHA